MLKLHIIVLQNRIKQKLSHNERLQKTKVLYVCLLIVHKVKVQEKTLILNNVMFNC